MTLEDFAELLGYGRYRTTAAHIEAGRTARSPRVRARIEAALGKQLLPDDREDER
jgi:hypothetical protein